MSYRGGHRPPLSQIEHCSTESRAYRLPTNSDYITPYSGVSLLLLARLADIATTVYGIWGR